MSFVTELTRIINTGQSRSVILTGNVYDLFYDGTSKYVPLLELLSARYKCESSKGTVGKIITEIPFGLLDSAAT